MTRRKRASTLVPDGVDGLLIRIGNHVTVLRRVQDSSKEEER